MQTSWLKSILRRIRKLLGLKPATVARVKILQEYHAQDGSVSAFRLHDSSIPGIADLWKIERHKEGVGWFALAIDLSYLREDLSFTGLSAADYLKHHHSSLAGDIERQFVEQSRFLATHYWICGLSQTYTSFDSRGRYYKNRKLCAVTVLAGDYQGTAGVFVGQRYIERINRKLVDQLANNQFREFAHHPTWKAAVASINWAQWHEGILQGEHGITPNHKLQVPKSSHHRKNRPV